MSTHAFDKYEFDLPTGWTTRGRFPAVTAYKPDGVGTLLFFSFEPEKNQSQPINWSDFKGRIAGKTAFTKDDKTFSRTWAFLRTDGTCLHVHYRCAVADVAREHAEVDQILASLREATG